MPKAFKFYYKIPDDIFFFVCVDQLKQTMEQTKRSEELEKQRHKERMEQMNRQQEHFETMMKQMDSSHKAQIEAIRNSRNSEGRGRCTVM